MGRWRQRIALALLVAAPLSREARALPTYSVGTVPLAAGQGDLEFPLAGDFRGQVGVLVLGQGTYDDNNPFAYLSRVTPSVWVHYDGIRNLRLSTAFEEHWYQSISPMGIPSFHEERFIVRARVQEPRGTSALYQILQLDIRSFDDPSGKHQIVFRPRLRVGVGFNLDATRIHSMSLFQEAGLRFADSSYTTRAFDFYRAVVGYTWTTRRGTFITLGLLGQASLNPAGSRVDLFWGPVLGWAYRIAPRVPAAEAPPPEPPDIEP
ncbi:MAG TPA: hypothetical protein VG496_00480 [Myxococcales bacterium]|nr:hypothetical protein [Myxococcales bacterium]